MVSISYRNRTAGGDVSLTIDELSQLLVGSSIEKVHETTPSWGDEDGIVVRTTDGFAVKVALQPLRRKIDVVSIDYGDGDRIPISVNPGGNLTAWEVERRIHSLRQLYATIFLVEAKREDTIPEDAELDHSFDLEEQLLSPEERLSFKSIGTGSLWISLRNATQIGWTGIGAIYALFHDDLRSMLLRRLRARTESEEIDVARKQFDLQMHKAKEWIEFEQKFSRLKNEDIRKRVEVLLNRNFAILQIESSKDTSSHGCPPG